MIDKLKDALTAFWAILTQKYYFFASVKRIEKNTPGHCNISSPAKGQWRFLEAVSDYARIVLAENYKGEYRDAVKKGLKKLGIGIEADPTPLGIEEAKWKVMQSILMSLVIAGAIKIEVNKTQDGKSIVTGYMYVEDELPEVPTDEHHRIAYKTLRETKEKYPFFEALLMKFDQRTIKSNGNE